MEEKHNEKRKYPRAETGISVKYRKLGESQEASGIGTISKNLSEGGVRFKAPEFISMARRLVLELDVPLLTKPIKAISKVAWIRKTQSGEHYDIGNQFLEMSRKDKELVSEYINGLMPENKSDDTSTSSQ